MEVDTEVIKTNSQPLLAFVLTLKYVPVIMQYLKSFDWTLSSTKFNDLIPF